MRIAITNQGKSGDFQREENSPWDHFFDSLARSEHSVVSLNEDYEGIVFMNFNLPIFLIHGLKIPKNRRFLVLWESEVNKPLQFMRIFRRLFGYVYIPSDLWRLNGDEIRFNWPQDSREKIQTIRWQDRISKLILINSNRISFASKENYSRRRILAHELSDILDLFGSGWNSKFGSSYALLRAIKNIPGIILGKDFKLNSTKYLFRTFPNYLGFAEDKLSIMSEYKFALIIENSSNYISEKLVDAIIAGCVPIYIGPKIEEFNFPAEIAIRVDSNSAKIRETINSALTNPKYVKGILESGQYFLKSEEFAKHKNTHVLAEMSEHIVKVLT